MKATRLLYLLAGAASLSAPAFAQNEGQRLAQQGGQGVAACASCHGAQGEGNAAAGFPRIAGLSTLYFEHQMHSFANGQRGNPVMTQLAKALNEKDIAAVAEYYASLPPAPATAQGAPPGPKPAAAQMKRAEQLAVAGDESRQLQACANCHGPQGMGEPPVMPPLGAQHASYLSFALKEWKSGVRKTDPSGQMPAIAKKLNDQEIEALSAWYASQPLPPPVTQRIQQAARPGAPSQGAQATGGGAPTTAGTGSEMGAGQTGGSQGAGGTSETGGAPQRTQGPK